MIAYRAKCRLQNSGFYAFLRDEEPRRSVSREQCERLTREVLEQKSVSSQFHSSFAASPQTFCLTVCAYLTSQKYRLFSSLRQRQSPSFEVTSDTGSLLFRIAPWNCFGDDINSFIQKLFSCYNEVAQKLGHNSFPKIVRQCNSSQFRSSIRCNLEMDRQNFIQLERRRIDEIQIPGSQQIWQENKQQKTDMYDFSVHDCTQDQNGSPYFSSIVRQSRGHLYQKRLLRSKSFATMVTRRSRIWNWFLFFF